MGRDITVVGAGIAGLAVATALALRGAQVTVLEQAEEIREVGAGIQISPNGFAVLKALGLEAAFRELAVVGERVILCDHAGDEVATLDIGANGEDRPYSFVHRADLINLLLEAARDAGVQIKLLQKVARVEFQNGTPALVTEAQAAQKCEILIGADGVRSQLRSALNPGLAPRFSGQVAWRAVVPVDIVRQAQVKVFMAPGRHMVCYPLRDQRQMNLVAVQERDRWVDDGWHTQDDPENLQAEFADFCAEARSLLDCVETVHLWGLFRHEVAHHWYGHSSFLLGDAAHPTLPFLAQGANMALEDAWVLAASIVEHEDLKAAGAAYQKRRRPRVVRVIEAANRNARNYHIRSAAARFAAHNALRLVSTFAPDRLMGRFNWLYGHDVTRA